MANPKVKHKENIEGSWYCTSTDDTEGEGCIACNACFGRAPQFFAEDEDGNAYVWRQPETEEDVAICQEQLDNCPVNSIGGDG
jgi:ferredoxin